MVDVAPMYPADWPTVQAIYRDGLKTGLAAFMNNPPSWSAFNAGHLLIGRFVVRAADDTVIGWSALSPAPDT